MTPAQKLAQWNLDLQQCCGSVCRPKKYLSGLAKEALEPEPIEEECKRVFGRYGDCSDYGNGEGVGRSGQ